MKSTAPKNIQSSYQNIIGSSGGGFNKSGGFSGGMPSFGDLQSASMSLADAASRRAMAESAYKSELEKGAMEKEYGLRGQLAGTESGLRQKEMGTEYGLRGQLAGTESGLRQKELGTEYGLRGQLAGTESGLRQKEMGYQSELRKGELGSEYGLRKGELGYQADIAAMQTGYGGLKERQRDISSIRTREERKEREKEEDMRRMGYNMIGGRWRRFF